MTTCKIIICMPVFNDWESANLLIPKIDRVFGRVPFEAELLIIDDGSTQAPPADFAQGVASLKRVDILKLRRNLGHQRAIAVGLAYISEHREYSAVQIMDCDGEDSPDDIPSLLARFSASHCKRVVFAKRQIRNEGFLFKLFYQIFKVVHRCLTGRKIEVGNFSVIPAELVSRLVLYSETWNHYAASVFRARIPFDLLPTTRARRIAGVSKMIFVDLVIHGLNAMSVFSPIVGVRLLVATLILSVVSLSGLFILVVDRGGPDPQIPAWATILTGLMTMFLLQTFFGVLLFLFTALHRREGVTFLLVRDYVHLVHKDVQVITNACPPNIVLPSR